LIDNWDDPDPNPVELSVTNFFWAALPSELTLDYKHFTGDAQIRLSWTRPGAGKEIISKDHLIGPESGQRPTGVSIDSEGNIRAFLFLFVVPC
jgi:hypothetical protein